MRNKSFIGLAGIILAGCATHASAEDNTRYAVDFQRGLTAGVLGYKAVTVHDFLGTKLDVEGWGLLSYGQGKSNAGIAGAIQFPLNKAKDACFYAGVSAKEWDSKPSFGLIVGISWQK